MNNAQPGREPSRPHSDPEDRQDRQEQQSRDKQAGGEQSESDFRSRYPCRMPVRMTAAERARIGKIACAGNLSISRFLVENALQERPGKSASPADAARLRYLFLLFQEAARKIRELLASPHFNSLERAPGHLRLRLEETSALLSALCGEIQRRISGQPG